MNIHLAMSYNSDKKTSYSRFIMQSWISDSKDWYQESLSGCLVCLWFSWYHNIDITTEIFKVEFWLTLTHFQVLTSSPVQCDIMISIFLKYTSAVKVFDSSSNHQYFPFAIFAGDSPTLLKMHCNIFDR